MVHPARRATFADLDAIPETLVGELIDGELITSPRPRFPHINAASVLGDELVSPFQRGRGGPGGWWVLDEPELHLSGNALIPDLAGWRVQRMPDPPLDSAFTTPPDWICEVVSPSTEALDRARKMAIYAREGVRHAWLVNPLTRTLEVYRLEPNGWLLLGVHTGDASVRAEPFDAIARVLGALWSPPVPAAP